MSISAKLASTMAGIYPKPAAVRIGPIGLDFALEELHLVQMGLSDGRMPVLKSAVSMTYPMARDEMLQSDSAIRSLVRKALKAGDFNGSVVVSSMPQKYTNILPLNFQVKPGQDETSALLQAARERIESALTDYVMDFLPVRRDLQNEDRFGILALAKREDVIRYLELLRMCGFKPRRLEIGPVAIRRVVSSISAPGVFENVIAINFGREASYISVISGRRLLLDQSIEIGEQRLLDDIGSALGLPAEQIQTTIARHGLFAQGPHSEIAGTIREIVKPALSGLVEEINRTLIYIASQTRGEPVRRIYLLGSLARWPGVDQLLNAMLKLEVETIPNPLKYYAQNDDRGSEPRPEIAVATGLALSGLVGE